MPQRQPEPQAALPVIDPSLSGEPVADRKVLEGNIVPQRASEAPGTGGTQSRWWMKRSGVATPR